MGNETTASVIDWMLATAQYMEKTRPDLYTVERALNELNDWMEYLRVAHADDAQGVIQSGGFTLIRIVEDEGMEEFELCRVISSVTTFQPENECLVVGWVDEVNLPRPTLDDPDDV